LGPIPAFDPLITTAHKEREQSGDRRNDGERNCNSGDGTGQMAQPWMFMMMMMMMIYKYSENVGNTFIQKVGTSVYRVVT
jgi:hypothetical protein